MREVVGDPHVVVGRRALRQVAQPPLRPRGSSATSMSLTSTRPASGARNPAMIRSVVVFPAPFGPTKPTTSPRPTRKLTPSSACTRWKRL